MTPVGVGEPRSAQEITPLGAGNACDREFIHLSAAIQPHGFLVAVDAVTMVITAASANVPRLAGGEGDPLGLTLAQALGQQVARAVAQLRPTGNPHDDLPVRFGLAIVGESGSCPYDMVAHRSGPTLVLEFERVTAGRGSESAGFYVYLRDAMKTLMSVEESADICRLMVRAIQAMTGYDRVMIYRFEPDAHGQVIAEACREDAEPFLGLHYPASDIPRQARALYLRHWIRVISDVDYRPVAITALADSTPVDQFDLSMSVLRSVSPVHLTYLRNMGVRATMTISLVVDDQLWGMVACHHDTPKLIDPVRRLACETLGQLASVRLRAAEAAKDRQRVTDLGEMVAQVVAAMAAGENPAVGAAAATEPLLRMTGADGVVLEIGGVRIQAGEIPHQAILDVLVPHLLDHAAAGRVPSQAEVLPELIAMPSDIEDSDASPATGTLFLRFPGRVTGFVMWLRGERPQTIRWAGRPEPKPESTTRIEPLVLSPRASFQEWKETVRGHSLPWSAAEVAAAVELGEAMPEVLLHRAQNRLVRLALRDPLTGLPNRTFLHDQLSKLLDGGSRGTDDGLHHPTAVLVIDVDGIKGVSEADGRELLTLVAQRIAGVIRPQDTVARAGDNEFVVLAPDVDPRGAAAVGQRIVDALRSSFFTAQRIWPALTPSVGVTVPPRGTDPGEALRQADTAMYHAKRSGRDPVAIYDPKSGTATSRRKVAREELSDAIASGQITVHYQPIMSLTADNTQVLSGFEALARWQHPIRGLVPPDLFIGIAEEGAIIDALGHSVRSQALRQLRAWPDRQLTIAINASVQEIIRPGFALEVGSQLVELGIDPSRLCLEITESQIMEHPDVSLAVLSELDATGVRIGIDDFGTGFSSLAYVRDLPATQLKIDRLFVAGLPHDPKDRAVVTATIQLAHSLGMQTVAEGVETLEQLNCLRDLGSDFAQGYLLGKPLPAEAVQPASWTAPPTTIPSDA